jgi:hypothetical protein
MNTAQDEAWSVSKKAVMDCKLTSPGLMFFQLAFVFDVACDVTASSLILQILR